MLVLLNNKFYELDMSSRVLESLKKTRPNSQVEMLESTKSNYKRKIVANISEITDYSVERNLIALGRL